MRLMAILMAALKMALSSTMTMKDTLFRANWERTWALRRGHTDNIRYILPD